MPKYRKLIASIKSLICGSSTGQTVCRLIFIIVCYVNYIKKWLICYTQVGASSIQLNRMQELHNLMDSWWIIFITVNGVILLEKILI